MADREMIAATLAAGLLTPVNFLPQPPAPLGTANTPSPSIKCDPEFDNPYPRTGNPDKERRARSRVSVRILTGDDAGGGVRIGARRIDV